MRVSFCVVLLSVILAAPASARYVRNNPLRYVDPDGLSAKDVNRIEDRFNRSVDEMKRRGERSSGNGWVNGALDNVSRFSYDMGGPGRPFLGCGEQADKVVWNAQQMQNFDDTWTFETDQFGAFHQTGFGYSSNPNDPILIMDPWANRFTRLPRVDQ